MHIYFQCNLNSILTAKTISSHEAQQDIEVKSDNLPLVYAQMPAQLLKFTKRSTISSFTHIPELALTFYSIVSPEMLPLFNNYVALVAFVLT